MLVVLALLVLTLAATPPRRVQLSRLASRFDLEDSRE
jgi:hypothetical protein